MYIQLRLSYIKWITAATCVGMFIVLIAGALVTKTESGRGCGDDWPLCNGKFLPAYTWESMIEYSHRAVSGVVGILVLLTFIAIIRKYGRRSEAYIYASGIAFFTVLQAILGAMAVKWEQSSIVMALHFGFSMLAFTFTLLTFQVVRRGVESHHNNVDVSHSFTRFSWLFTVYSYIVVYIGAYVRHTDSSGGCSGWPLCNNEVIPELSGATGIAFVHRLAALLLFVLIAWMAVKGVKEFGIRSELGKLSSYSLLLVLLQIFSGAFVVLSMSNENLYVFASLVHTSLIAALFAILSYISIRTWQQRSSKARQ